MNIIIIACVGTDGAIGRGGDLAFHISEDLRRFKALTTGHTVIMGRKTFDSLPKGALPNRRNIIITRNPALLSSADPADTAGAAFASPSAPRYRGAEFAPSLEAALRMAADAGETDAFIIGGGEIYRQALPLATRLEITAVEAPCPGADTFFPPIDPAVWVAPDAPLHTDPRSGLPYRFLTFTSV